MSAPAEQRVTITRDGLVTDTARHAGETVALPADLAGLLLTRGWVKPATKRASTSSG